jgi:peptide/nickel transport system permease protein
MTVALTIRQAWPELGSPWLAFTTRRLARFVVSLFLLVSASFAMIHLIPGDPLRAALGITAPQQLVDARRHALGLDRPLVAQYGSYLHGVLRGDLGVSINSQQPVSQVISDRLPATVTLALAAFAVIVIASIPIGMAAADWCRDGRHRATDLLFTSITGLMTAVPEFLLAVGMVFVFAVTLRWFAAAGQSGPSSYVLPVLALSAGPLAALARLVRVEALRSFGEDYIRTARVKRLPARLVYLRHALPNILTSTLTFAGLMLSSLVAGTVLVENVFAWPGLGTTIVQSITQKDYALVQGVVLIYGAGVLLVNLAVDITLGLLDPRSTIRES